MAGITYPKPSNTSGGGLDFEAQLWAAADKMRGHMDASEYKHVRLGHIFLKYISDAFEEKRDQLLFGFSDPKSEWFIKDKPQRAEAAENRDEYLAANVFWLPPEDAKQWLSVSKETLIARRCAYWCNLKGEPTVENETSRSVRVLNGNIFSPEALKALMTRIAR